MWPEQIRFFDITNLIWHPCTNIVFKNWMYVQFEKIDKKAWILRIKGLYNKEEKVD